MKSTLVTGLLKIKGWRLSATASLITVLAAELIVSAMSLLFKGEITYDYMITGLVASAAVAPPGLALMSYLIGEISTSRQQLASSARTTEKRLDIAIQNAQILLWELDLVTSELRYDDAMLKVLAVTPDIPPHSIKAWLEYIHPDDRALFMVNFQSALQSGDPMFDMEYRYEQGPDQWGWAHTKGQVVQRDGSGAPLLAVGSTMNITERKNAEHEFRDAQSRFELIFNNNPDVMVISRLPEGIITNVNDAFTRNTGYSKAEAVGNTTVGLEFWSAEDRQKMTDAINREGYCRSLEFDFTLKDGQKKTGSLSAVITRLQGIPHLVSTVHDITDRKNIEDELKRVKERYDLATRIGKVGTWDWNPVTGILLWSDETFRLMGYAPDTVTPSYELYLSRVHPEDREFLNTAVLAALHESRPYSLDCRIIGQQERVCHVAGRVEFDANQNPVRMLGTIQDITDRKRDELALAASRNLLKTIIDTAPMRVFWKDTESRYLGCNPGFALDAGVDSPEDLIGKADSELGWHAQADLYRADDLRVMESGIPKLSYEEPQTTPDGHEIWLQTSKIPLRDEAGKTVGILGIYEDITERKSAEEELRLAATVLNNSSEALLVTDANNRILDINPAFTKLTGYALADIIDHDSSILHSDRHSRDFYLEMRDQIELSGHWQGEVWSQCKNGAIFAIWLTINTIYRDDGMVHRRVALFSDITERKKSEELIWTQANFDSLTQLPNRRMFRDRLAHEIRKAHRSDQRMALMFLDLDHFKEVNDTLGHDLGDVLLVEAARRIASCVRESDTVARLGGDEFTVILSELDDISRIEYIAQNIINTLGLPFDLKGKNAYISASVGITLYPDDANDIEDMLKNADQAMFVSKRTGRNRYSFFTNAMQEATQHRQQIIDDLRIAIAEQQFGLYFQPIIELASGRLHKAEALLRWFHPTRGPISPAEFIPLAEDSGLIHDIGEWVFAEAVKQAQHWQSAYGSDFQISVNMSPIQMQATHGDVQWFQNLAGLGLSGSNFVFEITEGLLLDTSSNVTDQLLAFRDAGIQVAIDDFGTGYSALSYLKKMDIDYLKIDQSFTRNLAPDSSDMALSEAIIVMAHKLGLKVIAEGVETEAQHRLLSAVGCDYGQGYYYGKPMSKNEFEAMLKTG